MKNKETGFGVTGIGSQEISPMTKEWSDEHDDIVINEEYEGF